MPVACKMRGGNVQGNMSRGEMPGSRLDRSQAGSRQRQLVRSVIDRTGRVWPT